MENWKSIEGTCNKYEVSDIGRVRSLHRNKVRIMPHTKQHHGYHAVMLWVDNKPLCKKVHRLVAQAFIPNPNDLSDGNHKDGTKDNNSVDNLEWCTHQQNVRHSYDTGLKKGHQWTDKERKAISAKVKATIASRKTPGRSF